MTAMNWSVTITNCCRILFSNNATEVPDTLTHEQFLTKFPNRFRSVVGAIYRYENCSVIEMCKIIDWFFKRK